MLFLVELDHVKSGVLMGLPLWQPAEWRVTPLIAFLDRRKHLQTLLDNLAEKPSQKSMKAAASR